MPLSRPTVVIAGAEQASRQSLETCLADAGFPVRSACTVEDALVFCDVDPPDVLIIDGRFPDMDGFELCNRVRHDTRDFDVIVIFLMEVTDDMTRTYLSQMVDFAGGDYFATKPCDLHWLLRLLDTIPKSGCKPLARTGKSRTVGTENHAAAP